MKEKHSHQIAKALFHKGFVSNCRDERTIVELLRQAAPDEAHQNKKPTVAKAMVGEVGAARFELATSWSQTRRDDRATLRPAQIGVQKYVMTLFIQNEINTKKTASFPA